MTSRTLRADTLFQSVSVAVILAIVCRLVGFGRGVLMTRTLSPEELGTWALIANAIALLAFICTLGIPNGLARYTERFREAGNLGKFFLTALTRAGALTVLVCLAGMVFWRSTGRLLFDDSTDQTLIWITLGAVAATVLLSLIQGMLQGLRLFRLNSLVELAQNFGFLLMAVVLFGMWSGDAEVAAWAILITTLMTALLIGWWLIRCIGKPHQGDHPSIAIPAGGYWWPIMAYSLGAWSAGSLQALWRVIDRYMLLHLSSASGAETLDQIGQYYIASKLGQPLGALAGVVSMALLPHAAKLWESKRQGEVTTMVHVSTKLAILIMTFGGALLLALKGWIIPLVAGRDAAMTAAIFAPVLLTVIAVSVHFILRTYLMCKEQTWRVTAIWVITLLANGALNVVLIPHFQLWGAAWATMISGGVAVALTAAQSQRSGMRVGPRLILCLTLPCVLLLPTPAMLALLMVVALATHFTDWILDSEEKQSINQQVANRFERFSTGRIGAVLAPRAP